jgi:GTPase SAR1 family protein
MLSFLRILLSRQIGAQAAKAGVTKEGVAWTIGDLVVLDLAVNEAYDLMRNWDVSTEKEIVSSVINKLPSAITDDADEAELYREIANWVVDSISELRQEGEGLFNETFDGELVLRFGSQAFNPREKVALPTRSVDNALQRLLKGEDLHKEVAEPIEFRTFQGSGTTEFHLDAGLIGIIAGSGAGKSTFIRNILRHLVSRGEVNDYKDIDVGFVPWNERDSFASTGPKEAFVSAMNSAVNTADVVAVDSLREFIIGGQGAAGFRGMNTEFLMNLTQWHHQFLDRGVCVIAVINPILGDADFTDVVTEVLRGSTNGFLHITERGKGNYEHVRNGRTAKTIEIPKDLIERSDRGLEDRGSVEFDSIDLDDTEFTKTVNYFR